MKRTVLLFFAMILLLAVVFTLKNFFFWEQVLRVKDITQEQIITLAQKNRAKGVYGLRILVTGYIDGTATIQRSYEDKTMVGTSTINEKVHLRLGGDWYGDKCLIHYRPSQVKSGQLQIRYKFLTL